MISTAMVLAAGLGTRMRPLTATLPKPLISVAGKTMLERTFEHLKKADISRIVVNTHYLASLIEQTLPQETHVSREDVLLETGGGVKKALPLLQDKTFFVLNGDSVWTGSASLKAMTTRWDDAPMDAMLLLIPREKAHGYEGRGDFFLSPTARLSRPVSGEEAPYVYGGVQILGAGLFEDSPHGPFSLNLLWDKAIKEGRLYGYIHQGDWFHISTPEDLARFDPIIQQFEKESA